MFYTPLEALGAFALTCVVIELTPGPNMAYLAVLSAGSVRRSGFAATILVWQATAAARFN